MRKVKRILKALAWLALAQTLFPREPPALQANTDPVSSITSALRNRDYADALRLAQAGLAASPKDVRLLTLEGITFASLRQDNEALHAFHSALGIAPNYIAALEGAAQIEYKTDNPEAAPLLDRLLRLKPDEQTAHAMRAVIAWKQNDCSTAVRHFEQSRNVIASQPEALKEYGVCLIRLQRPGNAVPVWQQAVAADPANKAAVYSLASAQMMATQWADALTTLKPLTTSEPPDARALELASTALEATGDTPGAVAALRRAILLDPHQPEFYVDFAQLALTHKSYQVGVDMVNAGLRQIPQSPPLYVARGVLEVQLAKYTEADADFTKADQLDARLALGATARGLAAAEQSDLETALATVRQELKTQTSDPFLYYVLAEILSARGAQPGTPEFQQAVAAASKAIELKPDFALARDTLSRLYLKAGQAAQAIEQCRLALRANPLDATAVYRLIRALQSSDANKNQQEIADLLKRFAAIRDQLRQKEAQEARFQLVEAEAPNQASGRH